MAKPVILTGLRANNDLHIGNFFGALLPLIDMAKTRSDEYEVHLFVPDLHSFTTPIDHSQLQSQIMHNLRLYAAAGLPLDNPSVHIYRQSYIPAHSELTWILDCFTGVGHMERMTQFKDKSASLGSESISMGLFNYPVLMAADILLYGARYVPVGDDQTQHLEFARDIAERMNSKFGQELFTVPEAVKKQHEFFGKDQGLRIKDLQDPTKKMSKSGETGKGIIFLGDSPEAAAKKIHSATTDSFGKIDVDNQDQPGIVNLMQILALAAGKPYEEIKARYTGQTQYGPLKVDAAAAVSEFLHAFQDRLAEVDEVKLTEKLEADEVKMNEIANATLARTQRAVGLR
jgi:tryptophanyl-tRNA synthetase